MSKDVLKIQTVRRVGEDWMGYGYSEQSLSNQLKGFNGSRIIVPVNSYGGSVFEGLAIYNILKGRPETIETRIIAIALSMGGVIASAASSGELKIPKNGYFMLHNPRGGIHGDSKYLASYADLLKQMEEDIARIYSDRTGLPSDEILAMMDKETWLSAHKAKELGFVDILTDGVDLKAEVSSAGIDADAIHAYVNPPTDLVHLFSNKVYVMNWKTKFADAVSALNTLMTDIPKPDDIDNAAAAAAAAAAASAAADADAGAGAGDDAGKAGNTGGSAAGDSGAGDPVIVSKSEFEEAMASLSGLQAQNAEALSMLSETIKALRAENKVLRADFAKLASGSYGDSDGSDDPVSKSEKNFRKAVKTARKVANETEY